MLVVFLWASAAWCCSQPNPSAASTLCAGPVLLKPSGFFDLTGVARSNTTVDGVSTNFGAIPLVGARPQQLFSIGHSRLAVRGEMPLLRGTLAGYFEVDFLTPRGSPPWRLRQAWGEYRQGKWRFLGGQAWSLVRANQRGVSSEKDLIDIDVIDPAFHVGLLGDRKRQIQVIREVAPNWLLAGSYEEGGQFVAKTVHDRKRFHLEGLALARRNGAWGVSATAVIHATQRISFMSQQFATDGAGQEAVGGVPPGVRSYSTIEGAEVRLPRGMKMFGYAGLVYAARSEGNRTVNEWTIGAKKQLFTWSGVGGAALAAHYSHVDRAVWSGGKGRLDYVMVSLRFTIPPPR